MTIDLKEVERRARAAGWRVSDRFEDGNGIMFENIGMPLGAGVSKWSRLKCGGADGIEHPRALVLTQDLAIPALEEP